MQWAYPQVQPRTVSLIRNKPGSFPCFGAVEGPTFELEQAKARVGGRSRAPRIDVDCLKVSMFLYRMSLGQSSHRWTNMESLAPCILKSLHRSSKCTGEMSVSKNVG